MSKSLNSRNGFDVRCDQCGEDLGTIQSMHGDYERPTGGGVVYKKGIFSKTHYFCSDGCKNQWKNQNE